MIRETGKESSASMRLTGAFNLRCIFLLTSLLWGEFAVDILSKTAEMRHRLNLHLCFYLV